MGQDRDENFPGVKSAAAIGYSMMCNLGGERQMTIQCFVGEDESDEIVNARIDRIFRVVDRQKAKYDLDKEEKLAEECALHLRNFLNAIPIAEKALERQIAVLTVELNAKEAAKKEVFEEGYAKHVSGGRSGVFKPSGALESRLRNMDADIQKTRDAIVAAPRDNDQHRQQAVINVRKYQDDLKKRREYINELRSMAGREAYTAFLDEETANPLGAEG